MESDEVAISLKKVSSMAEVYVVVKTYIKQENLELVTLQEKIFNKDKDIFVFNFLEELKISNKNFYQNIYNIFKKSITSFAKENSFKTEAVLTLIIEHFDSNLITHKNLENVAKKHNFSSRVLKNIGFFINFLTDAKNGLVSFRSSISIEAEAKSIFDNLVNRHGEYSFIDYWHSTNYDSNLTLFVSISNKNSRVCDIENKLTKSLDYINRRQKTNFQKISVV
jgi:hypothetical protein